MVRSGWSIRGRADTPIGVSLLAVQLRPGETSDQMKRKGKWMPQALTQQERNLRIAAITASTIIVLRVIQQAYLQ